MRGNFGSDKKYGSDFLYHAEYYKIPKHHFELIKTLKHTWSTSYYANKVLVFDSKDNPHIKLDDFKQLSITINFLFNYATLSEDFIKKYDVKKEHIALMHRTYLDEYDSIYSEDEKDEREDEIWKDNKRFAFGLGYKRPYGNSYVQGDILEEWMKYNEPDEKLKSKIIEYAKGRSEYEDGDENEPNIFRELISEYFYENDVDFIWDIHFKAMDIMIKYLQEEEFYVVDFKKEGKWFHSWEFGIKTIRLRKLKKIDESIQSW